MCVEINGIDINYRQLTILSVSLDLRDLLYNETLFYITKYKRTNQEMFLASDVTTDFICELQYYYTTIPLHQNN